MPPPLGLHPVQGHDRHRGALAFTNRSEGMGLGHVAATLDFDALKERITSIEHRLEHSVRGLLESQG